NVGEIAAATAGDQNFLADAVGVLEDGDTPAAFAGFNGAEKSGGTGAENQSVKSVRQECISLERESAVCRVSDAMTLKVKLCEGEDRENCLRLSARENYRKGTASRRSSKTFLSPSP